MKNSAKLAYRQIAAASKGGTVPVDLAFFVPADIAEIRAAGLIGAELPVMYDHGRVVRALAYIL